MLKNWFKKPAPPEPQLELEPIEPEPTPRRSERESGYKEARITYPGGYVRRGVVLDHSDSGARIRFNSRETLPDIVDVRIAGLSVSRRARVVWRDAPDVGLEFIS